MSHTQDELPASWPRGAVRQRPFLEHRLVLAAKLVRELAGPVDLSAYGRYDGRKYAAALGVSPDALHYARKHGHIREYFIQNLWGRWGKPVPILWNYDLLDPGSCSCFRPPPYAWGADWQTLAGRLPDDFEQVVHREPVERPHHRTGQDAFRGWRWVCPGCSSRVRVLYYPVRAMTLTQWLGEDADLLRRAGLDPEADAIPAHPATFACNACHKVAGWSSLRANHWNKMIGYLTGGLLFGREVERPPELAPQRQRAPRVLEKTITPRLAEVERLYLSGMGKDQIAAELSIQPKTAAYHLRLLCRRRGVQNLIELTCLAATPQTLRIAG